MSKRRRMRRGPRRPRWADLFRSLNGGQRNLASTGKWIYVMGNWQCRPIPDGRWMRKRVEMAYYRNAVIKRAVNRWHRRPNDPTPLFDFVDITWQAYSNWASLKNPIGRAALPHAAQPLTEKEPTA